MEECIDMHNVILYDEKYMPSHLPEPEPLPAFNISNVLDNWVGLDNTIGDVFENGSSLHHSNLTIRFASRAEGASDLQDPTFNECRVPLVVFQDFVTNYFEVTVHALAQMHMLPYHAALLAPFTPHPVKTLADFSARRGPAGGAGGAPGRCFRRAALCKWRAATYYDAWHAMQWVNIYHRSALDRLREEWGGASAWRKSSVLRVVIEARDSPVRNFLNLKKAGGSEGSPRGPLPGPRSRLQILAACNRERGWQFPAGSPFRSVKCSTITFSRDIRRNARAVRDAHVLVGIHGSGLANAMLMRYGASLLEILPYNFTECCGPSKRFYGTLMQTNRDAIQYWSISIEDPAASQPGEFERRRAALGRPAIEFDMRDRRVPAHVVLRWDVMKRSLEEIAGAALSWERYNETREAGWTALVQLPEGYDTLSAFNGTLDWAARGFTNPPHHNG
eukprot:scaffold4.g4662.t1